MKERRLQSTYTHYTTLLFEPCTLFGLRDSKQPLIAGRLLFLHEKEVSNQSLGLSYSYSIYTEFNMYQRSLQFMKVTFLIPLTSYLRYVH